MTNPYDLLGIPTIINGSGSKTELGGTVMAPSVAQAMAAASQHYVHLPSLVAKVESKISELLGVEAVGLCAGASAGISMAAAACIAGEDKEKIAALPNTHDWPTIFLAPTAHRNVFDHAISIAGGQLQYFEPNEQAFTQLISNPKVVGVYYTYSWFCQGAILPLELVAEIAHQYNKVVVVDAAAQVPPVENFRLFLDAGADLVIFSGGKTIEGPQVSGLILGKKEWVGKCKLQASPNIKSIGRGMKIAKEEVMGLYYALELYLKKDQTKVRQIWEAQLTHIQQALAGFNLFHTSMRYPSGPGYQVPYLALKWNHHDLALAAKNLLKQLESLKRPIYLRFVSQTEEESTIWIYAHTLQKGEEHTIAEALTLILLTH